MSDETPPGYWHDDDLPDFEHQTHAQDAELTLYWPWVRPCWQEQTTSNGGPA